jgi:hypothetical protein
VRCRVCRRPVTPAGGVAFGVAGKPIFYAHTGECADTITEATGTFGKFVRIAIEAKVPGLFDQITRGIDKAQRLARILTE